MPADFKTMDWRNPDVSLSADLILAADVAYEERAFQPLIHTFNALYKRNGKIILSEPNRKIAKPFIQLLEADGWKISKDVLLEHLDEFTATINIFTLEK